MAIDSGQGSYPSATSRHQWQRRCCGSQNNNNCVLLCEKPDNSRVTMVTRTVTRCKTDHLSSSTSCYVYKHGSTHTGNKTATTRHHCYGYLFLVINLIGLLLVTHVSHVQASASSHNNSPDNTAGNSGGTVNREQSLSPNERPPVFVQEPESFVAKETSKVVLYCDAEGSTSLEWILNGSPIQDVATQLQVVLEESSLVIPSFRRGTPVSGHEGIYQCVARNRIGAVISRQARLQAAYLGEFYEGFKDSYINISEGNVAFIPCAPPGGRPVPITSFELNGTEIDLDNEHHHLMPSGNLQISNVNSRHRGRYQCVATNPLTNERKRAHNTVHLNVFSAITHKAPLFPWVPPSKVKVTRGHNLTLECVVEGAPVPIVMWSKYGGKLPEGRHHQSLGNLILYDVNKLDEGTYICGAQNRAGPWDVTIAEVDVEEPPVIQQPLVDQAVTVGDNVTLDCQGRGPSEVTVHWYHDAEELTQWDNGVVLSGSSLFLSPVQTSHAGVYQCVVQSALGSVSSVAVLSVQKNKNAPSTADNDKATENTEGMQGIAPDLQRKEGTETPGGEPSTNTNPLSGGASVSTPSTIKRHGDILNIGDDIERAERRRNKGKGKKGKDREKSRKGKDSEGRRSERKEGEGGELEMIPPSKPLVTKLSDTSVMLEWTVDTEDSLPITFFKVQYKELSSDGRRQRWRTIDTDIPGHFLQFEVPGLRPGSTYRFRIVAIYSNNDNLHGPNSRRFTMATGGNGNRMLPDMPLTGPVIVEARPTETTIRLKWQYLPDEWTPLEGFHIYYETFGAHGDQVKETLIGSHIREAELIDLMPNTMYSIRMTGYNSAGESEFSNKVVKRTTDGDYQYPEWVPPGDTMLTDWPNLFPGSSFPPGVMLKTTTPYPGGELSSRYNTESSNQMLYLILGCVLGFLVLFLLLVMGVCAWKQHKRAQTLQDQAKITNTSQTMYSHDSVRKKPDNSGFLLSGIAGGIRTEGGRRGQYAMDGTHGSLPVMPNGHVPYPPLHSTESLPLGNGRPGHPPPFAPPNPQYPAADWDLDQLRASLQEILDQPPAPPPPLEEDVRSRGTDDGLYTGPTATCDDLRHHATTPPTVRREPIYSNDPCAMRSHDFSPPPITVVSSEQNCGSEAESAGHSGHSVPRGRQLSCDHIPRSHERLPAYQKNPASRNATTNSMSSPQVTAKHNHRRRKDDEESGGDGCVDLPHHHPYVEEDEPNEHTPLNVEPTDLESPNDSRLSHPSVHSDFVATDYEIVDDDDYDSSASHEGSPLAPACEPYGIGSHQPGMYLNADGAMIESALEYSDEDNVSRTSDLDDDDTAPNITLPTTTAATTQNLPKIPRVLDYPATDGEDE